MGRNIEAEGATIALNVGEALADDDVIKPIVDGSALAARQPVFRRGVTVAKDDGRQTRHGVIAVRNTELGAGLRGHEAGKVIVAHARRPKRIHICYDARLSQVRGAEGRNGAAERVAGGDDLEVRVGFASRRHGGLDAGGDLIPGGLEARVDAAALDEVAVGLGEDDIGDPVADVVAAADRDDDFFARVVSRYVAADASIFTTVRKPVSP